MSIAEMIQWAGTLTGLLVVISEIIKHIKEWRGGSPELRLLNQQITFTNNQILGTLSRMSSRVVRIGPRLGI
jgi:hypothetical protein